MEMHAKNVKKDVLCVTKQVAFAFNIVNHNAQIALEMMTNA